MKEGDAVTYKAIAGDTYDAIVRKVRDERFVDLDVIIPQAKELFPLTAIRIERIGPAR